MKPLITIVMPVYNAGEHIEQVLDNITTQTFLRFELLVIDALSTDGTGDMVAKRSSLDPRIRLIAEKDLGIYDAMNKGIRQASGEWLYFMGADDRFDNPGVLENVSKFLKNEIELIYGDSLWMPGEDLESGVCDPDTLLHRSINHQRIFYRKSLFEKWGGYDLQYPVAADHELNIRFFCNRQIQKLYIPFLVAKYHAGGYSAGKIDAVFWKNWKAIFYANMATHLPSVELYNKLGWYCRYQLDNRNYAKSFLLFCDVFFHTLSPGFVLLTAKHFFQSLRNHAG